MVLQFKKLHFIFSHILEKAINEIDLQKNIRIFSPFLIIDFITFLFFIIKFIKILK